MDESHNAAHAHHEATRMPLWWLQPLEVALTGQNSFLETWTLRGKGGGRAAVAGEIQFGA